MEEATSWKITSKQILAGALSGCVTKTSVAPLDRIKILFQVQGMNLSVASSSTPLKTTSSSNVYQGTFQTFTKIIREEGFRNLYRGNLTNLLRIIPNYSLKFTLNDFFKAKINERKKKIGAFVETQELSIKELMLAGSLAGFFQYLIAYPLEVIRTRMTMGNAFGGKQVYSGISDCFKKTYTKEGFRGFYKGLSPTLLTGVPYVTLQMTLYQVYQRLFMKSLKYEENESLGVGPKILCGALTGLTAQAIVFPGDTLKRRMQTNGMGGEKRKYKNTRHAMQLIWRQEGKISGFYKGMGANIIRCLPSAAIQFASYDFFKSLLLD